MELPKQNRTRALRITKALEHQADELKSHVVKNRAPCCQVLFPFATFLQLGKRSIDLFHRPLGFQSFWKAPL